MMVETRRTKRPKVDSAGKRKSSKKKENPKLAPEEGEREETKRITKKQKVGSVVSFDLRGNEFIELRNFKSKLYGEEDAIGPGAKNIPYICNEIQQQTMSMIYLGIPEENVFEKHIEGIQRYCGFDATVNSLASQYVHKLGMIIKRSTHELDLDDQASIKIWAERNKKSIFFYQESSESEQFMLGIQTEWQLQQFVRFGHCSLVAADSTFGIKRLKKVKKFLIPSEKDNQDGSG